LPFEPERGGRKKKKGKLGRKGEGRMVTVLHRLVDDGEEKKAGKKKKKKTSSFEP